MEQGGSDLIELGMPFTDPIADGPTIQKSNTQALKNGVTVTSCLQTVRDARKVATVAGFGPRFLHSTGQAYKGGPNTGKFLVITREPDPDLAIPRHRASFGTVQIAQARGDADVLAERGRQVLRLHLKRAGGGIAALKAAIVAAL